MVAWTLLCWDGRNDGEPTSQDLGFKCLHYHSSLEANVLEGVITELREKARKDLCNTGIQSFVDNGNGEVRWYKEFEKDDFRSPREALKAAEPYEDWESWPWPNRSIITHRCSDGQFCFGYNEVMAFFSEVRSRAQTL